MDGFEVEPLEPESPKARHQLKVCQGLACTQNGSGALLRSLEQQLGQKSGQVGAEGGLLLEGSLCMGRCAVGPNIKLDGVHHPGMDLAKVMGSLKALG